MAAELRAKYRSIVEEMFNRWTALRLAVEHGMHVENNGLQAAIEILDYMTDYCIKMKKLEADEVQDTLDQIMDQEYDTICDDNSTKELGAYLVRYLTMLRDGKDQEIINEINQLPSVEKWITPKAKINYVRVDESSSDESDGEQMDTEIGPSSSGSTTEVKVEEEVDPGWTAGGVAGVAVDIALFPIDTVKTRLQSERGFWRSGGFKGIYRGLAPAAVGSAPTAALFFFTYETTKTKLGNSSSPFVHMAAASVAEVVACLIRVPVEIAKQRRQSLIQKYDISAGRILLDAFKAEGFRGIYRGFGTTILREIPFSLIQFPLWEYFKANWKTTTGLPLTPYYVSLCGAVAGGIAAGLTTPLDVAKTRIMLAEQNALTIQKNIAQILIGIYREKGIRGVFAGFVPRVLWITIGGAVFFGFYDLTTQFLSQNNNER
uniref:Pre-rRNA-processing protein TSR2 homolog n=1 Tax=Culicoides sonorensis TaxID=179676 RepID=A0A336LQR1_CULSO